MHNFDGGLDEIQDDLLQLVFAPKGKIAELESED